VWREEIWQISLSSLVVSCLQKLLALDFIGWLDPAWSHQQLQVLQSLVVSLLQVTLPIQDSFFKF
jgi:hypothetical protein